MVQSDHYKTNVGKMVSVMSEHEHPTNIKLEELVVDEEGIVGTTASEDGVADGVAVLQAEESSSLLLSNQDRRVENEQAHKSILNGDLEHEKPDKDIDHNRHDHDDDGMSETAAAAAEAAAASVAGDIIPTTPADDNYEGNNHNMMEDMYEVNRCIDEHGMPPCTEQYEHNEITPTANGELDGVAHQDHHHDDSIQYYTAFEVQEGTNPHAENHDEIPEEDADEITVADVVKTVDASLPSVVPVPVMTSVIPKMRPESSMALSNVESSVAAAAAGAAATTATNSVVAITETPEAFVNSNVVDNSSDEAAAAAAAATAAAAAAAAAAVQPTEPQPDNEVAEGVAAAAAAAVAAAFVHQDSTMIEDKQISSHHSTSSVMAELNNLDSEVQPTDRDVYLKSDAIGFAGFKANLLLDDIIRLHRIIWILKGKGWPSKIEDVTDIVERIMALIKYGKVFELAGLKDVPKPFMKSLGSFVDKTPDQKSWYVVSDNEARKRIGNLILEEFKNENNLNLQEIPYKDFKEIISQPCSLNETVMPDGRDAILLRCAQRMGEKIYEQQGGNKAMFTLASQLVTSYTSTSDMRVEAALTIMRRLDETEHLYTPDDNDKKMSSSRFARFLIRTQRPDDSVTWELLSPEDAAEFTVIFVFEVFLEKEMHIMSTVAGDSMAGDAASLSTVDTSRPGALPIGEPTDYDVLFGRGGMTNSHPGNRRFRDVISLHRPDYIRAIKMDKPAVARKIVKAIRLGNPPGRFLKKGDDNNWYDVGDRTAAEKTSQGLRERSNAEKRQRSALREALRIRKQDMTEDSSIGSNKKVKLEDGTSVSASVATPTLNYIGTNLPVPLSLNMKDQGLGKSVVKKKIDGKGDKLGSPLELNTAGLPPNAVDDDGNILVTDYDILCGRGGLTNHHKGNKRFRDIVALHRPDYVRAPKIQKPSVARVIVRAIRNGDPPGRFLKKDEKSGKWVDIGDKKAAEKTSQALREKTNDERDNIRREPGSLGVGVLLPSPSSYLAGFNNGTIIDMSVQNTNGVINAGIPAVADDSIMPSYNAESKSLEKVNLKRIKNEAFYLSDHPVNDEALDDECKQLTTDEVLPPEGNEVFTSEIAADSNVLLSTEHANASVPTTVTPASDHHSNDNLEAQIEVKAEMDVKYSNQIETAFI